MMANDASCDSADLAVPCQMARDAADDSTLDASLRLGGGARKGNAQNGGTDNERLHRGSPKMSPCNNRAASNWFHNRCDHSRSGRLRSRHAFGADADNRTRMCNMTSARKTLMDGVH
jgi:hypothetical protein